MEKNSRKTPFDRWEGLGRNARYCESDKNGRGRGVEEIAAAAATVIIRAAIITPGGSLRLTRDRVDRRVARV